MFEQGIEDYMGDMDMKLAGSKKGITALQVRGENQAVIVGRKALSGGL